MKLQRKLQKSNISFSTVFFSPHFSETFILQYQPQNLQFLSKRLRLSGAKLFVLCLYAAKYNRIPI